MELTTEQYAEICSILTEVLSGHPMPAGPRAQLIEVLNKASPKKRASIIADMKRGYRMFSILPDPQSEKMERLLMERGLPSLRVLAEMSAEAPVPTVASVLKKGRIESELEHEVVDNELGDTTSDLTDDQRMQLGDMMEEFSKRARHDD